MLWCMQRTNIYLTEEQQRALDARARVGGTSRSAVLRAILDESLQTREPGDDELRAAFAALADGHDELVAGLFDDDPDLRIEG
ncbi:hypothetical protein BH20ACT2_BH20ACT2_24020 [soil metagenome]